jgi:hypothetical protein
MTLGWNSMQWFLRGLWRNLLEIYEKKISWRNGSLKTLLGSLVFQHKFVIKKVKNKSLKKGLKFLKNLPPLA